MRMMFAVRVALVGVALVLTTTPVTARQKPSDKNRVDGYSYERWMEQDVRYIATPDEKVRFKQLKSDEDRDRFIEHFWERRNPTPGSEQNTFKTEHYRRIAYANQHFAADVAGWRTDRGRIYIVYGAPDWVKDEAPATSDAVPMQLWHYKSIPDVGTDVTIRFVDSCRCKDYRISDGNGLAPHS